MTRLPETSPIGESVKSPRRSDASGIRTHVSRGKACANAQFSGLSRHGSCGPVLIRHDRPPRDAEPFRDFGLGLVTPKA